MSLFKRTLAALITAVLIPMATLASNVTGTIALPNTALKLSNGTISMVLSDAFGKPTSAVQAGSFVIASSTVSCYTSTDGTVVGIPNPLVAPLAAAQAASGSLSGTYYVKITYYDASAHESLVSPGGTPRLASIPHPTAKIALVAAHAGPAKPQRAFRGVRVRAFNNGFRASFLFLFALGDRVVALGLGFGLGLTSLFGGGALRFGLTVVFVELGLGGRALGGLFVALHETFVVHRAVNVPVGFLAGFARLGGGLSDLSFNLFRHKPHSLVLR